MPQFKFLNLVKPVMFLIPEIKAPQRAVRIIIYFRSTKERNSFGQQ